MTTVLIVIHLIVVLAMIGLVLLQRSEGGALGIGGGGGGFMSGRGAANFLTRVTAGLAANRGRVQQWGCRSSGHQQWKLVPVETGSYRIIGRASGKCLEVASQRLAEGARLRISTCRNRANQRFRTPSVT